MLAAVALRVGLPPASLPHHTVLPLLRRPGNCGERKGIGDGSNLHVLPDEEPNAQRLPDLPGASAGDSLEPLAPGSQLHHSIHPLCPTCLTPVHGDNLIKK